jgi:hypothetical protein
MHRAPLLGASKYAPVHARAPAQGDQDARDSPAVQPTPTAGGLKLKKNAVKITSAAAPSTPFRAAPAVAAPVKTVRYVFYWNYLVLRTILLTVRIVLSQTGPLLCQVPHASLFVSSLPAVTSPMSLLRRQPLYVNPLRPRLSVPC